MENQPKFIPIPDGTTCPIRECQSTNQIGKFLGIRLCHISMMLQNHENGMSRGLTQAELAELLAACPCSQAVIDTFNLRRTS